MKWHLKRGFNGLLLTLVDAPPTPPGKINAFIFHFFIPLFIFASEFVQLFAFFAPSPPPTGLPGLGVFSKIITIRLDDIFGPFLTIEIEQGLFFGSALFCIFGLLLALAVTFSFSNGYPQVNKYIAVLLRSVGIFMSSVAYMLLLMVMVNGMMCQNCNMGPVHHVLGSLGITSMLVLAFFVVSNLFPADPRSGHINRRPHARFDVVALILRTLVPLNSALVMPFSSEIGVVINFVISILFVALFLSMQPYYSRNTNALKAMLYLVLLVLAALSLLSKFLAPSPLPALWYIIGLPSAAVIGVVLILVVGLGPNDWVNMLLERLLLPLSLGYDPSAVLDLALATSLKSAMRVGHFASYISAAWGLNDQSEQYWRAALLRGGGHGSQFEIDYALWCRKNNLARKKALGLSTIVQHLLECNEKKKRLLIVYCDVNINSDRTAAILSWRRRMRRSCLMLLWTDLVAVKSKVKTPYYALRRLVSSILGQSVDRLGLEHNYVWKSLLSEVPSVKCLESIVCGEDGHGGGGGSDISGSRSVFSAGNWAVMDVDMDDSRENEDNKGDRNRNEDGNDSIIEEVSSAFEDLLKHLAGQYPVMIMLTGIQHIDPLSWECVRRVLHLSSDSDTNNVTFLLMGVKGYWSSIAEAYDHWVVVDGDNVNTTLCASCGNEHDDVDIDISVCRRMLKSKIGDVLDRDQLKLLHIASAIGNSAPVVILKDVCAGDNGFGHFFTRSKSMIGVKSKASVSPASNFSDVLDSLVKAKHLFIDELSWYQFERRIVRDVLLEYVSVEDFRQINTRAAEAYRRRRYIGGGGTPLPFYAETMLLKHEKALVALDQDHEIESDVDVDGSRSVEGKLHVADTLSKIALLEADGGMSDIACMDSAEVVDLLESIIAHWTGSDTDKYGMILDCITMQITKAEAATFSDRPTAWQAIALAQEKLEELDLALPSSSPPSSSSDTSFRDRMKHLVSRIGTTRAGLYIAESSYTEAETEARKVLQVQFDRSALFTLARSLRFQDNRTTEALAAYERVVSAARKSGDLRMQALSTSGLATLERGTALYRKAESHFKQATFLFRMLGQELMGLDCEEGLSMNHLLRGNMEKGANGISRAAIGMARLDVPRALLHTGVHMMDAAILIGNEALFSFSVKLMEPYLGRSPMHGNQIRMHRAILMICGHLKLTAGSGSSEALVSPPFPSMDPMVEAVFTVSGSEGEAALEDVDAIAYIIESQKLYVEVIGNTDGIARRRACIAFLASWVLRRHIDTDIDADIAHGRAYEIELRQLALALWMLDGEVGIFKHSGGSSDYSLNNVDCGEVRRWFSDVEGNSSIEGPMVERGLLKEQDGKYSLNVKQVFEL